MKPKERAWFSDEQVIANCYNTHLNDHKVIIMQSVGIKEIKTNPDVISKTMENHEYLLISKRGKPIAVATALDDKVFDLGLKKWILIKAFEKGSLSLGQLSRALDQSYTKTVKLLDLLNIPTLDYELDDEMDTVESLL